MRIRYEGLALPVNQQLAAAVLQLINRHHVTDNTITINFRDPNYSAEQGGFHPVEIRLEQQGSTWRFCYITDFCYVGNGSTLELAKDLDFNFQAGVFQNLFGVFPIEQATDIYQIWESNFLHYWKVMAVYSIELK